MYIWIYIYTHTYTNSKGEKTSKTFLEWVTRIHFMVGKNSQKMVNKYSSEIIKIKIYERKIRTHEKSQKDMNGIGNKF